MWTEIPKHFPRVLLDEFVVMPDHIHGLLFVDGNRPFSLAGFDRTAAGPKYEDPEAFSTTTANPVFMAAISPRAGTLSVVIRSFKSAVTRWCHENGHREFAWQTSYFDSILQPEEMSATRVYIIENPQRVWARGSGI